MSTYEASYCSQKDVQFVLPEMAKYNQRTIISPNWVASSTSNLYYNYVPYGGGFSVLFKDGKDLGTEHGSEPGSNDQWRYVEADSRLEYFLSSSSLSVLNGVVWEGGQDADDHLTSIIARASDFVRSMAGIPIYPRKGVGVASATGNDYPELIVLSTAHMSASFITAPYDLELSNQLAEKVSNPEGTGWLDMLRRGEISINQQETLQKNKGIVRKVSLNGSTTSDIVDVRGKPTVLWDLIKISIDSGTGATLTRGSNSSIKYSTKGSDDDGLQVDSLHTAETVTGGWDEVGHGMWVRWSPGVLTDGDTWEMEISGEVDSSTTPIKMSEVQRI
jgi:hypothetical protein